MRPFDRIFLSSEYAEAIPGATSAEIAEAAKENGVHVVAGSIPEREGDKVYNTCCVFDPEGNLAAKHRKLGPEISMNITPMTRKFPL